jgi:phosphoglucosamine mutase
LGGDGRMVIRPSGTEPVIRVMVEGADASLIDETVQEMAAGIRKHLS